MRVSKSYKAAGKILSPLALAWMRAYARIAGIERARSIIFDQNDRVLLVRSWVGTQLWELPGGAIKKDEAPLDAALRETYEEVGLTLDAYDCTLLGVFRGTHIFATAVTNRQQSSLQTSWEIIDYQWCALTDIPKKSDPFVTWALQEVSK